MSFPSGGAGEHDASQPESRPREHRPSVDVPLYEEDLRIQHYRVERSDGIDDIPANAFQEMEFEIPIRGEEVWVRTRAFVREEVQISKELRQRNEYISMPVRRESIHVEHEHDRAR